MRQDQLTVSLQVPLDDDVFAQMRQAVDCLDEEMIFNSDVDAELDYLTALGSVNQVSTSGNIGQGARQVLLEDIARIEAAITNPSSSITVDRRGGEVVYTISAPYNDLLLRSFTRVKATFLP